MSVVQRYRVSQSCRYLRDKVSLGKIVRTFFPFHRTALSHVPIARDAPLGTVKELTEFENKNTKTLSENSLQLFSYTFLHIYRVKYTFPVRDIFHPVPYEKFHRYYRLINIFNRIVITADMLFTFVERFQIVSSSKQR